MRKRVYEILFVTVLLMSICSLCAYGQSETKNVCVTQETINKCAEVADKYRAALDRITELENSLKDRDSLIVKLQSIDVLSTTKDALQDKAYSLAQTVIALQDDVIKRQDKKLNSGKFQRFLKFLKVAYYILAGGAIIAGL